LVASPSARAHPMIHAGSHTISEAITTIAR
jgi:hypothetical protein